jgi:NifU-like protein involved in Fe-S cluster formation
MIACHLALAPLQMRSAALAEDATKAAITDYRMKCELDKPSCS